MNAPEDKFVTRDELRVSLAEFKLDLKMDLNGVTHLSYTLNFQKWRTD
jgi:hypothetical protein